MNKVAVGLMGLILMACSGPVLSQAMEEAAINLKVYSAQMLTSGKLNDGGIEVLAKQGVASIIDLRTAAEGVEEERKTAQQAGIKYFNIPIGGTLPSDDDIANFKSLLESHGEELTLVHCGSGNRVGTLWSMYRIQQGVDTEQALAEGRTMGMSEAKAKAVEAWNR